jgi:hypothetical protein
MSEPEITITVNINVEIPVEPICADCDFVDACGNTIWCNLFHRQLDGTGIIKVCEACIEAREAAQREASA